MRLRPWISLASRAVGLGAAACAFGCSPLIEAARPADPTFAGAAGAKTRLGDAPFVVDARPEDRGDIEVAMKRGIVVVAYRDGALEVLPRCSVEGAYDFVGITKKEEVLRLRDEDAIASTLPLRGAILAAQLGGELRRGATLDVALVMVGERRASRTAARRDELHGDCAGATHVVLGSTVGAFVMDTGTRAEARTVAQIFGAGVRGEGASSKSVHTSDGDLAKCGVARPDATAPPDECGALLRLHLAEIAAAPPPPPVRSRSDACAPNEARVGGECISRAPARACPIGDKDGCEAKCEGGDAASCYALAWMYERGFEVPRLEVMARSFASRACAEKDGRGCALLASLATDVEETVVMLRKGCEAGHGASCTSLAARYAPSSSTTATGVPRDEPRAMDLLARACGDLGDAAGCTSLGKVYREGGFEVYGSREGPRAVVGKDQARADRLFFFGCESDDPEACFYLGLDSDDRDRKDAYYARACALDKSYCRFLNKLRCERYAPLNSSAWVQCQALEWSS